MVNFAFSIENLPTTHEVIEQFQTMPFQDGLFPYTK